MQYSEEEKKVNVYCRPFMILLCQFISRMMRSFAKLSNEKELQGRSLQRKEKFETLPRIKTVSRLFIFYIDKSERGREL